MTTVRKIANAREVADWLDQQGEHVKAEEVRGLCRAAETLRHNASTLHGDALALRTFIARSSGQPDP